MGTVTKIRVRAVFFLALLWLLSGCMTKSPNQDSQNVGGDTSPVAQTEQEPDSESSSTESGSSEQGAVAPTPGGQTAEEVQEQKADMAASEETIALLEHNLTGMEYVISNVKIIYPVYELPVFYPVDDDSLDTFRAFIEKWNNMFPEFQLNPYGIEPRTFGYSVTTASCVDAWNNPYYIFFEVQEDDNSKCRNSVASAGPDGELVFQGTGVDYSESGFGDDVIEFFYFNNQ